MAPRAPALLVARSLQVADQAACDWRWERVAIARYRTPDGEEVIAAADRSTHLIGRPRGTRIFLAHGWTLRDDFGHIQELLDMGRLVAAPLPEVAR